MLIVNDIIRAKGYTIDEIAKKLCIPPETLVRDISEGPTTKILEMIAYVLDVNIADLFDQTPKVDDELYGLVIYKKKTYRINNRHSLSQLYHDVEKGHYQVKPYF